MKTEKWLCDINGCHNEATIKNASMQVIFTTEQTEGRSSKRYFSNQTLDLCQSCLDKALKGQYIMADGAQGFNNYRI
jgi:hypothetical protein